MRLAWAVLISGLAAAAVASAAKVAKDPAHSPPGIPVPVIVQYTAWPADVRKLPGGSAVPCRGSGIVGKGAAQYLTLSGTSMAAAVTSAGAALLIEKDPGLTPDQVKARLMKAATKAFPASGRPALGGYSTAWGNSVAVTGEQ